MDGKEKRVGGGRARRGTGEAIKVREENEGREGRGHKGYGGGGGKEQGWKEEEGRGRRRQSWQSVDPWKLWLGQGL